MVVLLSILDVNGRKNRHRMLLVFGFVVRARSQHASSRLEGLTMETPMTETSHAPAQSAGDASIDHSPDRVRIVSTPGICGGRPRIDGHRIQVEDIAIWHERMGLSPDEIVFQYPSITLADVHAALAYYYENRERIDSDIAAAWEYAKQLKELARTLETCLIARERRTS